MERDRFDNREVSSMAVLGPQFLVLLSEAQAAIDRGRTKRGLAKLWRAASLAVYVNDEKGLETVLHLAEAASNDKKAGVARDARTLAAYCQNCLNDIRSGKSKKKKTLADLFTVNRPER
jgi:hypothetical protein